MWAATDRVRRLARRRAGTPDATRRFEELPFPAGARNIFDVGVVDLRQDGNLGVFTTNHNSREMLLANEGGGRFRDVLEELGLNQDVGFPSWADDVNQPSLATPGLYLYRRRNTVVLHSVAGGAGELRGELGFASTVAVGHRASMDVDVMEAPAPGGPTGTIVRFAARGDALVEITPDLVGLPLQVRLDERAGLEAVFVGPAMTQPRSHSFGLCLRDRHGMAWADHEGSGHLGVFIARGGLKGRLGQFAEVEDELLSNPAGGRFTPAASGIEKGGCRARHACWADLGGGAPLALFVSCHGGGPHLYRRTEGGRFVDVNAEIGLSDALGDAYAWVDVDGDGRVELLAARGDQLVVYARGEGGRFGRAQVVALRNRGGWVNRLAVGDWRGSGRPDVFAPSLAGNTLLVNDGGRYRALDPRRVGLPATGGMTANWVDYDNDGYLDLHVVPGGLFRGTAGGRFAATGILDDEIPRSPEDVRICWFDADNDGAPDVLVAATTERRVKGGPFAWSTKLYRNVGATGHWLQVELRGPPANPQAIGAAVTVRVGERRGTQWVGCNDGSHFSQGHYRLYFGLGEARSASVEVRWPDGSVQRLGRPVGDELVRIAHRPVAAGRHEGTDAASGRAP
ncbi:MAG: CRTAC1 family protein [Acidimicrobiales bacterium]